MPPAARLNKITEDIIRGTIEEAKKSPRKRAFHVFSKEEDSTQRMVNARLGNAYLPPHRHSNPQKVEIISILRGKGAFLLFDDEGNISDCSILDEAGSTRAAEAPPLMWHTFVPLSDEVVVYEIAGGGYDPATHKTFASWAPQENDEGAQVYLEDLKKRALEFKS